MQSLKKFACGSALTVLALAATPASAQTIINFTAQANIFGAGLAVIPAAPGGEGVLPSGLAVVGGSTLNIAVTGSGNPGGGYPTSGPNGFALASNITNATGSAIGNWTSANSLTVLGVFTGSGAGVNTIFAVGTGGSFLAPTGATNFYLGFADAFGFQGASSYYGDNTGTYQATINVADGAVPEPATWTMMIAGFGLIGGAMRTRRHRASVSFA